MKQSHKSIRGHLAHYDGGTQQTYGKMVQAMDNQIGDILQALDKHHLAENTIIVFTSDSGGERFSNIAPFTGMKGELLEGGLRIPVVVRWPAKIKAGSVSDQVSISMDWLPTFVSAAGKQPDPSFAIDGINLLPFLTDTKQKEQRVLSWRYNIHDQHAQLDSNYKYLKIGDNEFLFNVVDDPKERANLKARKSELFTKLK